MHLPGSTFVRSSNGEVFVTMRIAQHGSRSPHAHTIRQGRETQKPTIRTCLRLIPASVDDADNERHSTGPPCVRDQDRVLDTLPSIARLNDSTTRDSRSVVERMGVCRSGVNERCVHFAVGCRDAPLILWLGG